MSPRDRSPMRFFLHSVTDGVSVLAAVGDTSFPVISLTWLYRYYLNWAELDDAITEFKNVMPSNWVFLIVVGID